MAIRTCPTDVVRAGPHEIVQIAAVGAGESRVTYNGRAFIAGPAESLTRLKRAAEP